MLSRLLLVGFTMVQVAVPAFAQVPATPQAPSRSRRNTRPRIAIESGVVAIIHPVVVACEVTSA